MVRVARYCAVVACFVCAGCCDDPESSDAKSENSVMQVMEARHANDSIQQLTFKTEMNHHFVFVPWQGRHVCVMLDAKHTPHYKQYPLRQNFCVSQADYDTIEQSGVITDTVRQVLASHICDDRNNLTNR